MKQATSGHKDDVSTAFELDMLHAGEIDGHGHGFDPQKRNLSQTNVSRP